MATAVTGRSFPRGHGTRLDEAVKLADHANIGLAIDSFHVLARGTSREPFDAIPGDRIFLVQLSDYLWDLDDLIETARHRRDAGARGVRRRRAGLTERYKVD